ncbi:MAG TPA: PAS domain-containing sensor histidine kinase [Gaiellaceae bacterium]|nr:PAS domain-containing sensor histidine kinase [Gaiellaceae bacterium]
MPRVRIGMRWWLALTFAAIAAVTAFAVATVFNHRAASAFHDRAEELAIGQSVSASRSVDKALRRGILADATPVIADRRRFSVYVFSAARTPLSDEVSFDVRFADVPDGPRALRAALAGNRFVETVDGGRSFVIGLRLPHGAGAIVTYARRPELLSELGIVHDQIVNAALIALAVAALIGVLVAMGIAARLRRIARAAARIEAGAFDEPLASRFGDEVGALAETIDQMRVRLRESFGRLGEERDRLLQLLEGLHEGVVAVDRQLQVAFVNPAARSLLTGRAFQVGSPLPDLWPDFPLRDFARRLFDDAGRPVQARVVEDERTIALVGVPARGDGDAILVLTDITERERRERAEREFVANAAHELGTPLTAIATSLEVLRGGAKDDPVERDRFLELIERQTSRLSRLRRALLTLARAQTRQEALQLEPVDAGALLAAAAEELRAGAVDAEVAVDAPEEVVVLAQPDLIEQVVLNLAENALRHGSASRVELAARRVDRRHAVIEVRDDGAGIPAAGRDRLFDRFYRGGASGDGFGLGLAIVREVVRALGGTIELDAPEQGGTVVRLTLALATAPAEARR